MATRITPKKVEVMIKNHFDKQAMANELGLSLEEVDAELHKIYTGKAYKDICSRLKANEKMAKKLHPAPTSKTEETEVDPKATAEEAETVAKIEVETDVDSVEESGVPLTLESCDLSLEDVLSSIADKQSQLISLEQRHQKSASTRQSIRNRIDVKKKELLRLQESMRKVQSDVEALISEYKAEEVRMLDFNSQMSEIKADLDQLEAQRIELETLSILVYKDGKIEINNEEFEQEQIPDEWTFIYHSFYGKEELDALTGFEQKNLAKFFALLKVLPKGRKQDICFESNDMQAAFELLKGGIIG